MSCEKASRRLRSVIGKARRLGLSTEEVAELPFARKLLPARLASTTGTWTTLAMILLVLAGSLVLILFCAPCLGRKRT